MKKQALFIFLVVASCQQAACPSPAGGVCDPRSANCPHDYYCALAEVCTRTCAQTSDCWVSTNYGCRNNALPGQTLPDGGYATEESPDGFCPETKDMECVDGFCQLPANKVDGGYDYDVYGPSPFKGNRSQGPLE